MRAGGGKGGAIPRRSSRRGYPGPVSQLHHHQDDGDARCTGCGRLAVGPCARCGAPQCGDCCELVPGAAATYAVCAPCARAMGRLGAGWGAVLAWIVVPILLLLGAVVVLFRLTR